MKYNDISKGAYIARATDAETYDLVFTVGEIDYQFEVINGGAVDMLCINGNDAQPEIMNEIFYKIDGEFTSLNDLFVKVDADNYYLVEEWLKTDGQEQAEENAMRNELSSPYLTGRV